MLKEKSIIKLPGDFAFAYDPDDLKSYEIYRKEELGDTGRPATKVYDNKVVEDLFAAYAALINGMIESAKESPAIQDIAGHGMSDENLKALVEENIALREEVKALRSGADASPAPRFKKKRKPKSKPIAFDISELKANILANPGSIGFLDP